MSWNVSGDNTGVVTAIVANILLGAAINLQKYARKQIILMALHGLPAVNLRRLWYLGLSMLFASECANFVAFGLVSAATMTPVGVFTIISNCVLPPLVFESHMHTSLGSLISMPGILLLIVVGPKSEPPNTGLTLSPEGKLLLEGELIVGIFFVLLRSYKPANCSLKLGANCGLGALMGSHTVTAVKALISTEFGENSQAACVVLISITCVLQLVLLTESLQVFPVWQVVPHYFSAFIALVYLNSGILFCQFENAPRQEIAWSLLSYTLIIAGVWIAAIPHLDLPIDSTTDTNLLRQLAKDATERCVLESSSAALSLGGNCSLPATHDSQNQAGHRGTQSYYDSTEAILDNDMLREEYARHRHEELKLEQGFGSCRKPRSAHLGTP